MAVANNSWALMAVSTGGRVGKCGGLRSENKWSQKLKT